MKKALSFILAVVMMISCFVGMTVTISAEAYGNAMPGAHTVAMNISGKTYGYRAVVNQEFYDFGIYMPTWGASTGTYCSIALYEWDESYEKTLEGTPIVSQTFNPMNNSRLRVKFHDNPVPAGEYLFYVYDTCSANCGLFVYQADGVTDAKGVSYLDGELTRDFVPDIVVYTPDAIAGELFGICDLSSGDDFPPAVEPETTAPETTTPEPEAPTEPEIPEYANKNLALNAAVLTYLDNCYQEYGNAVKNLTDGNRSSQFCSTIVNPATDVEYDWIMVDLGEVKTINQVILVPTYDNNLKRYYMFPTDYEVQISTDNEEWTTVAEVVDYTCDTTEVVHSFEAQAARYVRIYVTGVDTSVHNPPRWFVYLKEFEVSYTAETEPETTAPAPEETTAPEPEVPAVPEYSESITDNVGGTYHGNYTVNYADKGRMIYQTYVNYDFIAFDFGAYTNSIDPQPYTYSLYKWDTSIENTLAGEPVASQRFEDLVKGAATARLEFDEPMPAGEYVFMVSDASGSVCVPFYTGVQNLNGTYYHKANLGVRDDAMPSLTVYTTDERYVEGTMFSKEAPAPAEAYVYINSLDGAILYNETVDLAEVDEAILAKLNAYANGTYNSFVEFKEISCEDGVHTYRSVHNTDATVTVNGETATPDAGGVFYLLKADETNGEGVPFYGWYDENAKIYLSYNATYKFFPDSASENITAVYKVAEKDIVANVTATRSENKLTVTVTPNYPSDVTNVKYGYYISTDAAALDVNNITASGDSTVAPHVYMVRVYDIQASTQDKNIYLLGWISYGEEARIYTSLITVAPDGTVTVAEA